MATCTNLIGGESQHEHSEGLVVTGGSVSFAASPRQVAGRGGSYCMRFAADASYKQVKTPSLPDPVGGVKFAVKIFARPSGSTQWWVLRGSSGVYYAYALLRADGRIDVYNQSDVLIGTTTVALTAGNWFNVWLLWDRSAGNLKVYVQPDDGTAPGTAQVSGSVSFATMGWFEFGSSPWGSNGNVDYDDLVAFSGTALPHQNTVVMLHLPVSDNTRAGWSRAGTGSTVNLWDSVNNLPPAGLFNDVSTDASQIADFGVAVTDAYDTNCQSYTAKGILSGDVVLASQAVVEHMYNVATPRDNAVSSVSNPAIAEAVGSSASQAGNTFPTGWTRLATGVLNNPTVALGTQPVVRVRRASTEANHAHCCFMGLLTAVQITIDTTPPTPLLVSETATKVSAITGKNSTDVTWSVDEDIQAWEFRVVPASTSPHTAGAVIVSGGARSAGTNVTTTLTKAALVAAGGVEGGNVVKLFTQDVAGNWST